MTTIDLNCDLGEGCANDAALMPLISSANIACGAHAGDIETMRRTVELALENNVAIGAHPGYADRENFGRISVDVTPAQVRQLVFDQIGALRQVCDEVGTSLRHVKPHGALYNQAASSRELADAIVDAVLEADPQLILFGLAGSQLIDAAEAKGLRAVSEGFADRRYLPNGHLVPRSMPDAVITDEDLAITQALDMVKYGRVRTSDATMAAIRVDTICIHGDGENAVAFAKAARKAFQAANIAIAPPSAR